MAANQLSKKNPDGTLLGQSAADLVAFHGGTPTSQAAFLTQQSINALSVSGVIGFTTSASLSRTIEKLNSIITVLVEKGLMASS